MPLRLLSLTGADDKVAPEALAKLTERYPFVEWALLGFSEKEGSERNPSAAWRKALLDLNLPRTALHLCGGAMFNDLLEPERRGFLCAELSRYSRVQVNINARRELFSPSQVAAIYRILIDELAHSGTRIIFQLHEGSREAIASFLASLSPEELQARADILFDSSKGTGQLASAWPSIHFERGLALPCGYAGGLGPDNFAEQLRLIEKAAHANGSFDYWADMESGIRTGNQFDLGKAEAVLASAEAFRRG